MVNPKRKIITICVTFFLLIIVVNAVFSYVYLNSNKGDEEIKKRHDIPGVDSWIWAYKDTPKRVLRKAKKFLKENGFCGDNIDYFFTTMYFSYINKDDFTFHVEQYYKGIDCSGYFEINLRGDIETIHSLKTAYELSLINTESDIDSVDAIQIGIDYLKLNENTTNGALDKLYFDQAARNGFLYMM